MISIREMDAPIGRLGKGIKLRVLVVDDHPDCAESLALLLRLHRFEVAVSRDGPSALEEMRAWQPDVVLLDIGLPRGMNGWELAKQIKRLAVQKQPLLVAVTGYGKEEDRQHSAECGIDLHLTKPVEPDVLENLLHRFERLLYDWDGPDPCGN